MTSETSTPASSLTDKEREAIEQMPYEEARDKLIQAVQALEAGGLNLDQSMRQWEIGEALAKRAQSLLGEVRARPNRPRPRIPQELRTTCPELADLHRRQQGLVVGAVNLLRLHLPRQHAGVEHDVIDSGEGRHIINIRRP